MVLPSQIIATNLNDELLVELKNGTVYTGKLNNYDAHMNLMLKNAYMTSTKGDTFSFTDEVYIRGVSIRYLRFKPEIANKVEAKIKSQKAETSNNIKNSANMRSTTPAAPSQPTRGRGRPNNPGTNIDTPHSRSRSRFQPNSSTTTVTRTRRGSGQRQL